MWSARQHSSPVVLLDVAGMAVKGDHVSRARAYRLCVGRCQILHRAVKGGLAVRKEDITAQRAVPPHRKFT